MNVIHVQLLFICKPDRGTHCEAFLFVQCCMLDSMVTKDGLYQHKGLIVWDPDMKYRSGCVLIED